jgi:hypothetical protein
MKEYNLPQDLQDIFTEYVNLCDLRDKYILLRYFGYRLALRATRDANKCRDEFWKKVNELYPETAMMKRTYDISTWIVSFVGRGYKKERKMPEKKKYVKLTQMGKTVIMGIEQAIDEIKTTYHEGTVNDTIEIEFVELSDAEIEALPEFDGY